VIGALALGLFLGAIFAIVGIVWRWWSGTPTLVTASGWALGPLKWGGWGILLGALLALGEVLTGTRLRATWGIRFVLSSVGSMLGGLGAWWIWTKVSSTSVPAAPPAEVKP